LPERARCIFLRERASSRTGVVAVLTVITAACYLLAAIGNITDFGTNQQEVLIAAVLIWALVAWVGRCGPAGATSARGGCPPWAGP
jgi:hypothetical protein